MTGTDANRTFGGMRNVLGPVLASLGVVAFAAGTVGAAAPPLPEGCTNRTDVSFVDDASYAPGTYTQAGPPAVSITLSELAAQTISFETTTPGWRILSVTASFEYQDEGGPLGQDETNTYGTGVTSSSFVIENGSFLNWGNYFYLTLADCSGATTTVAPTTAAPTTAAPTTAAPTTAAPTTAAPTTAAPTAPTTTGAGAGAAVPTTVAAALPETGSNGRMAIVATGMLLAGVALVAATRRQPGVTRSRSWRGRARRGRPWGAERRRTARWERTPPSRTSE